MVALSTPSNALIHVCPCHRIMDRYAKSGNYELAIQDYTKVPSLYPLPAEHTLPSPPTHVLPTQVIALDPGNSHAFHNRGISCAYSCYGNPLAPVGA